MKQLVGFLSLLFLTSFAYISYVKQGTASYYSSKFEGRRTASGEIFRQDSLTAAHSSLPFGTRVKVTNLKNDSVVIVRINDRMGSKTRIIDLSLKAAKKLNFVRQGLTQVRVEKIE
jgi:rare lipoprotein A